MAFVAGPRQVGKTTSCSKLGTVYLDWDNLDHREIILAGPAKVAQFAGIGKLGAKKPIISFDELHKFDKWKDFLKGFFDVYSDQAQIIVTGSSKLDVFRKGGDSLMGRYFLYHMFPYSVAELVDPDELPSVSLVRPAVNLPDTAWENLVQYGGYPEPYREANPAFSNLWHQHRHNQFFREDIRDLTRIADISRMEVLGKLLSERSGDQLIYSNLAKSLRVSENTVRVWIQTLESLHYGFTIRPWSQNVARSLLKEPKWYLLDWSGIQDQGKRSETFIACHLLKATMGWMDMGLGKFGLHYVRDKEKREVDFLVTREGQPWFLAEVKTSPSDLSPQLSFFQKQIDCPHAFQIVLNADYVDADCFSRSDPVEVPARTLLSQLF